MKQRSTSWRSVNRRRYHNHPFDGRGNKSLVLRRPTGPVKEQEVAGVEQAKRQMHARDMLRIASQRARD